MRREIIKSKVSRTNRGQQHKKYQNKIIRVGLRSREHAAGEACLRLAGFVQHDYLWRTFFESTFR